MARIEALITPSVLGWAREKAGLSVEDAARRLGRSVEDLHAWESGKTRPTIAQARKATEVYRRPLAVFYLPEPPTDFETLRDFRRLPSDQIRAYGQKLLLIMRTSIERQDWAREFLVQDGFQRLSFVGSASVADTPDTIASDILRTLDITPVEQCACRTRDEALILWIQKVESKGIFVFREGQVDLDECRGFALSDEYAPFIYLNSEDARAAQLFTLVHELVHIWFNESGVSNLLPFGSYESQEASRIETSCNRISSEVLLDRKLFEKEWNEIGSSAGLEDRIQRLSAFFKVSEEVIARRLLEDGHILPRKYQGLREFYQDRWLEHKTHERKRMKESQGGPSFYVKKAANNGYSFTRTVFGAFEGGHISGREASALLSVKLNHIKRLALTAGFPMQIRV